MTPDHRTRFCKTAIVVLSWGRNITNCHINVLIRGGMEFSAHIFCMEANKFSHLGVGGSYS